MSSSSPPTLEGSADSQRGADLPVENRSLRPPCAQILARTGVRAADVVRRVGGQARQVHEDVRARRQIRRPETVMNSVPPEAFGECTLTPMEVPASAKKRTSWSAT